jgi:hypothetical protein
VIINHGSQETYGQIFTNVHLVWDEYYHHDYLEVAGQPDQYIRGMILTFVFERNLLDFFQSNLYQASRAANIKILNRYAYEGQAVAIVSPTSTWTYKDENGTQSYLGTQFLAGVVESPTVTSEGGTDSWILAQVYGYHDHLYVVGAENNFPDYALLYLSGTPGCAVAAPFTAAAFNQVSAGGATRSIRGKGSLLNSLDPVDLDLGGDMQAATGLTQASVRLWGMLQPVNMLASYVVPPSASPATGTIFAYVDTVLDKIWVEVTHTVAGATAINLRGPSSAETDTGAVKSVLNLASPSNNVFSYNPADEADILNGLWYVEVESGAFPNGAIRGQVAQVYRRPDTTKNWGLVPMISRSAWTRNATPGIADDSTAIAPGLGWGLQLSGQNHPAASTGTPGPLVASPTDANALNPHVIGMKLKGATRKPDRGYRAGSAGISVTPGFVDFLGKSLPG